MWLGIGIAVGAVAVIVLGILVAVSRKSGDRAEISGDEMFNLGVVFTAAGVALSMTLGPAMIGMLVLGIVFMVVGARRKRDGQNRE